MSRSEIMVHWLQKGCYLPSPWHVCALSQHSQTDNIELQTKVCLRLIEIIIILAVEEECSFSMYRRGDWM